MIFPLDSLADLGAHGGIHSRAMHGSRSACRILTRAVKDHRFWRFASGLVCSAMQYVAVFSRASSVDQTQTHDQGAQCGLPGTETASHCSATVKYTGSQCNCDDSSERHRFSPNYPLAGTSIGHWVVWTRARAIRMLRHDRDRAKDCA